MTIKSGLNVNTPDRIFVDAGAVYLNYGLPSERLLGATRGGNEFNLNREIRDIEVDGVRGSVKGLRRRTVCRPQITCNLIELSLDNLLKAIAGANSAETPATAVVDAEYLGVGTTGIDDFSCAHASPIAGTRTSDTVFTRTAGTWAVDAEIGKYAYAYVDGSYSEGGWFEIIDNDGATITISGVLTTLCDMVKIGASIVPLSEKVYIDGVLMERGEKSATLFVGSKAAENKDFETGIGNWEVLAGGTFESTANGQAGKYGKYVKTATPTELLKLDDALGTVLTYLEAGKKYRITIYAKKGTAWTGGVVTIKCDGQSKDLPALGDTFVQTVFDFTAIGTDATITIDCESVGAISDELWIDTLEFVQFSGDYTIVNETGKITFNLEDVPKLPNATAEVVTISYSYETGDPATHDTITGGDIGDEDYIDNVALVGTISGKGNDVICMVKNALADTGFSLSTAPRDEAVPVIVFTGHHLAGDPDTEPWEIHYPRE